jgi:hypothetical protein
MESHYRITLYSVTTQPRCSPPCAGNQRGACFEAATSGPCALGLGRACSFPLMKDILNAARQADAVLLDAPPIRMWER